LISRLTIGPHFSIVTKIRIAYTCLLAVAVIIPSVRLWDLKHTDWTPLVILYPIPPTMLAPTEFTIDSSGVYEVVLKITRPPDGTDRVRGECLMGWDWGNAKWGQSARGPACEVAPVIDLTWHLIPLDGRPSEAGVLRGIADAGGFSVAEADRPLTAFSAKQGQRYRFEGQTSTDATALAFVRPRIVVQPTGASNEDWMVTTLACWAVAAVAGFAGLGLAVRDLWKFSRRTENVCE